MNCGAQDMGQRPRYREAQSQSPTRRRNTEDGCHIHESFHKKLATASSPDLSEVFGDKSPVRLFGLRSPPLASPGDSIEGESHTDQFSSDQGSDICLSTPSPDERVACSPPFILASSSASAQPVCDERDDDCEPEDVADADGPSSPDEEETEEGRRRREEAESEALARQLMAEEAVESYTLSTDFLRDHAADYTSEDLAALQAAMAEENPEADGLEEREEVDDTSAELSYDTLLRLGDRLGDVKQERWALVARDQIERLPSFRFKSAEEKGKDENDSGVKCLVCQCPYEECELLRQLPCGHCFHVDCADQWLLSKDICPYCRQSIVTAES